MGTLDKADIGIFTFFASEHPTDLCGTNGLPLTPNSIVIMGKFQALKKLYHRNVCQYLEVFRAKHGRLHKLRPEIIVTFVASMICPSSWRITGRFVPTRPAEGKGLQTPPLFCSEKKFKNQSWKCVVAQNLMLVTPCFKTLMHLYWFQEHNFKIFLGEDTLGPHRNQFGTPISPITLQLLTQDVSYQDISYPTSRYFIPNQQTFCTQPADGLYPTSGWFLSSQRMFCSQLADSSYQPVGFSYPTN